MPANGRRDSRCFGDFGADVIKVERRQTGDQSRSWGPPFVGGESAYFLAANRNKRSLSLDYDQPLGAAILHRLLATADVFLINQRNLASLERRGFDAKTICARYPRLVYCAISGYGHSGPRSGLPGYDIIAQAQAGIMSFTGEPEGEPVRYPIAIADMTCGLSSAMGILAALLAREKTGAGQVLDMALFDSQLTLLINVGSNYLNAGESPQRWGNAHPSIVPYQVFRGGDGRHFVAAVGTDALWQRFLRVIDAVETLGADARFCTNALRTEHRLALIPALCAIFEKAPAGDWLRRLTAEDIPASAIQTVGEAVTRLSRECAVSPTRYGYPQRRLCTGCRRPCWGNIAERFWRVSTTRASRLPPPCESALSRLRIFLTL